MQWQSIQHCPIETYDPNEDRYEYQLDNVGEDLDGRRLSIQTDEGGAYNVIIE